MEHERRFPSKELIALFATSVIVYESSKFALTREARVEAGDRDGWKCCGRGDHPCVYESTTGEAASYQSGYMVHLAHYPETQHLSGSGMTDPNPDNARVLCLADHALEHIEQGQLRAAQAVLNSSEGVYHINDGEETGREQIRLSIEDVVLLGERAAEVEFEEAKRIQEYQDRLSLKKVRLQLGSVRGDRRL